MENNNICSIQTVAFAVFPSRKPRKSSNEKLENANCIQKQIQGVNDDNSPSLVTSSTLIWKLREKAKERERELGFQRPYLLREKRKGSVSWWWRGKNANQASYLIISVCKKKLFSALYQLWFLLPSPRWWWFLTELTVVLTEITKVALTSSQNPIEFWMGILTAQPPDSWDLSHIFDPTRS